MYPNLPPSHATSAPPWHPWLPRLLLAGFLTAIADGAFATASSYAHGSNPTRTFQGVASVLLGKSALDGGGRTALIGLAMHVGVAFGWSTVFLLLTTFLPRLRQRIRPVGGAVAVAAVFGPLVWMVMSQAVIPLLIHRRLPVNGRWWEEFVGHFFSVGLPIVFSIRDRRSGAATSV